MLKDLGAVFRKSWAAFQREASRREPVDEVADLLGAMRREMVAARAALPEYEQAIRDAEAELEAERKSLADCERRRSLARKIGDDETVQVAEEFLARHTETATMLESKVEAAKAERVVRGREVEEMMRRYKEADANRFVLLSQLRAQRARTTMNEAAAGDGGVFDEFDRMAEAIDEKAAYAEAAEQMSELNGDSFAGAPAPEDEVEARLRELKAKLNRS